ncbi:MAG: DUF308 domain-containing protein [Lachnospiraceae bacterium]|nr:DUF308 domain-containing protein [Lachnospiraceae bacterium]
MLFEGLDRIKRSAIMSTIILMIAGNILLMLPSDILPFFNEIMGFALLVTAVLSIFHYLASKKALIHYVYLTIGLLAGMLGLCLLIFEGLLTAILLWMVCIFPILSGLYGIYHALVFARRSGRRGWWILIVLSAALIVFGGFVFYNPWMDSTEGTMRIIGGTMMYTAIISGLRLVWLWPIKKKEGGQEA